MNYIPIRAVYIKYTSDSGSVLLEIVFCDVDQAFYWIYVTNQGIQYDITGSTRIEGDWRADHNRHYNRYMFVGETEYSYSGGSDSGDGITELQEVVRASFPEASYSDIERWNAEIERMYMEYVL